MKIREYFHYLDGLSDKEINKIYKSQNKDSTPPNPKNKRWWLMKDYINSFETVIEDNNEKSQKQEKKNY